VNSNDEATVSRTVVPEALVERDQWLCWREEQRDGKATKAPVTPASGGFASATDPDTWRSFETAVEYLETDTVDGVGFVFTDEDPLVGVDLDDCRDPDTGAVDPPAKDIIVRLDSYTEVSLSGTGFHVLVAGELPEGRNRRGSVELYDSARYFTVTGRRVTERPGRVARRQDALTAIHREYIQDSEQDSDSERRKASGPDPGGGRVSDDPDRDAPPDVDIDDETLPKKARTAANGEKFRRLWKGKTGGYESHSEADMALCSLLAFWTGGDQSRVDRLFRESGLIREKWDEVHYADGSTYGEKTVERAVASVSEYYDPEAGEEADGVTGPADGDGPGQRHARLVEKNRLLTERVAELEAELKRKNTLIVELEAEVEQLDGR